MHLKLTFSLFVICLLPLLAAAPQVTPRNAEAVVADGLKRHAVEFGTVVYEVSGIINGTETVYFDHWGWREAKYTTGTSTKWGGQHEVSRFDMIDGELVVNADFLQAKATRTSSRVNTRLLETRGATSLAEVQEELITESGGKLVGKETILGKSCNVYHQEANGVKVWVWKGLTLKSEVNQGQRTMISTATSLDLKTKVDPAFFVLPGHVRTMDLGPMPEH